MISSVLACKNIERPDVHKVIQLEYNILTQQLSVHENIELPRPTVVTDDKCSVAFHIHIDHEGDVGFECLQNGIRVNQTFSRSFHEDYLFKFFSESFIIIRNKKCVKLIPPQEDCESCSYFESNSATSKGLYCYSNGKWFGLAVFSDTDKSDPSGQYEPSFMERPKDYLEKLIQLQYTNHSKYFVGEAVNVTLNWHLTKYYFSQGDVFVTLQRDGVLLKNSTIKYLGNKAWTNSGYSNSSLTLDIAMTKFEQIGTFLLTIYLPLWDSSEWVHASINFVVEKPEELKFLKQIETFVFYLDESHQKLTCDPTGSPEYISFSWNKDDNKDKILSFNQVLAFPTTSPNGNHGSYTCNARHRGGQEARKQFIVTVQPKDHTVLYLVTPVVFVALVLLLISARLFRQNNQLRLTVVPESDVNEFENGKRETVFEANGTNLQLDIIASLPYNKKYEVNRRRIRIDTSIVLGSGEFGVVYQGEIVSTNTVSVVEVAVKTIRQNSDISHIKSLLNELKVLSYLENGHRNVLHILGACTSRLRQGQVLVCVELCKNNLLNILCKSRESGTFNSTAPEFNNSTSETEYVNSEISLNTKILLRWSYEIADGMEFLAGKHVVHGDLAARNILMSKSYHVKISDFGLGRVMENYQYITIAEHMPLPWKWMAIESLVDRKFSSASDIWAFGITLWEIFSLGENPYNDLQWNIGFVQELRQGMRLGSPEHGPDELYALLVKCWEPMPTNRPDFTQLKNNIASFLESDSGGPALDFPITNK